MIEWISSGLCALPADKTERPTHCAATTSRALASTGHWSTGVICECVPSTATVKTCIQQDGQQPKSTEHTEILHANC